jgi:hypothetical protein
MKRPAAALMRCSRRLQCLMFALGILISADAHIVTAVADSQEVVEATCGTGLPVLTRDLKTFAIASLDPIPSPSSPPTSMLLQPHAPPPSALDQPFLRAKHCHRDKLHPFVLVFLF